MSDIGVDTDNEIDVDDNFSAKIVQQLHISSPEIKESQNARFSSWLTSRSTRLATTTAHSQSSTQAEDGNQPLSDPREYQIQIFERAKAQNIIAVLDTGSGKTLIAIMLMRHIIDEELRDRAEGKPHRITFFIVDSVSLVFQQHRVIAANIAQPSDKFCGDMGCDLWSEEVWREHLARNMVIVCTAQILHNILDLGFLSMAQINLIVFDEAHKAKKGHVYARATGLKPKILGLTASPVDGKVDIGDLELVLNATVATPADLIEVRKHVAKPKDIFIYYPSPTPALSTLLRLDIARITPNLKKIQAELAQAEKVATKLGDWAGDRVFSLLKDDTERRSLQARLDSDIFKADSMRRKYLEEECKAFWTRIDAIEEEDVDESQISPKVAALAQYLSTSFMPENGSRCIVFTRMRRTASLLAEIFEKIGKKSMRVGVLVGSSYQQGYHTTFRQQNRILRDFRKGDINILFATSVAEEGLDISDCNMVIRFDLYDSLIQYIQSRGRARQLDSTYVHMIQANDSKEQFLVSQTQTAESLFRSFCDALPSDRKLQINDWDDIPSREEVFVIESTQATLSHTSSPTILARYLALHPENVEGLGPQYVVTSSSLGFTAEVILPPFSPACRTTGKSFPRKSWAKRSAAFAACRTLYERGLLDDRFLPILKRQPGERRAAQPAMRELLTSSYDMLIKPSFWSTGEIPQMLHMLLITFKSDVSEAALPALAILTRTALPALTDFPIYNKDGSTSTVHCSSVHPAISVDEALLTLLTAFTMRVFSDVFSKGYENDLTKIPYWFCPVKTLESETTIPVIDLELLRAISDNTRVFWDSNSPKSSFENRLVIDYRLGSRKHISGSVDASKKPSDPQAAPVDRKKSILKYSYAYRQPPAIEEIQNQEVFTATVFEHRADWLAPPLESEMSSQPECWLCLSAFEISPIPVELAKSLWIFPAIMYQLDCQLLASELLQKLRLSADPKAARDAITLVNYDNPAHTLQLETYERLEFLGDCFLKMASAISLFVRYEDADEHQMHMNRREMVCNNNLLRVAQSLDVPKYIRSQRFNRRAWYPQELKLLRGKGLNAKPPKQTHELGEKNIADVAEAIIGAAYLHGQGKNLDNAVLAVSKFVDNDNHRQQCWQDYTRDYTIPEYQTAPASASDLDLVSRMYQKIGYKFKHPKLLRSAFCHPSWPTTYDKVPSYQRLEFLGDALLDMCAVDYLYNCDQGKGKDPGWLTEHKMAIASNKFMAALAVRLELHRDLRHRGDQLGKLILDYADELELAEEEVSGARDYWNRVSTNPPKVLADLVESLAGAIFVDSGFDLAPVRAFFDTHMLPFFTDLSLYDTYAGNNTIRDLKYLLAEYGCAGLYLPTASLDDEEDDNPTRLSRETREKGSYIAGAMVHLEMLGDGRGVTERIAKGKACEVALEKIRGLERGVLLDLVKCDCRIPSGQDQID